MTRTLLRPRDASIDDDTPITLAEACAGKYSVQFLLQEIHCKRLTAFKVGRRIFTTPAHLRLFWSVTDPRQWTKQNVAGIYIIGFSNYLKIGWSDAVLDRIEYLQQFMPEKLTLCGIIEAEQRVEFIAHRRFSAYRLRGEWFRNDGEIKAWAVSWARNGLLKAKHPIRSDLAVWTGAREK